MNRIGYIGYGGLIIGEVWENTEKLEFIKKNCKKYTPRWWNGLTQEREAALSFLTGWIWDDIQELEVSYICQTCICWGLTMHRLWTRLWGPLGNKTDKHPCSHAANGPDGGAPQNSHGCDYTLWRVGMVWVEGGRGVRASITGAKAEEWGGWGGRPGAG